MTLVIPAPVRILLGLRFCLPAVEAHNTRETSLFEAPLSFGKLLPRRVLSTY